MIIYKKNKAHYQSLFCEIIENLKNNKFFITERNNFSSALAKMDKKERYIIYFFGTSIKIYNSKFFVILRIIHPR